MNAAEKAALEMVKTLAAAGLITTHPDMNFGIVVAHEIPALLIAADTCRATGVDEFIVCATDLDDVRIAVRVELVNGGVYVHGAGEDR